MAHVKISNREELENWLERQPRQVAAAIASRAALRVLPLLDYRLSTTEETEETSYKGLSLIFHVISTAWILSLSSSVDKGIKDGIIWSSDVIDIVLRASYARRVHRKISTKPIFTRALLNIFLASHPAIAISHAVASARYAAKGNHVDSIDAAYHGIAYAAREDREATWKNVSLDAWFIENEGTIKELMAKPLWLDSFPD